MWHRTRVVESFVSHREAVVKLKTDSAGVAVPPRVRWWLLPVPIVLAACFAAMLQVGEKYHEHSLFWRIVASERFRPRPTVNSLHIMCFVEYAGKVTTLKDDSFDVLDHALARTDGDVWVVNANQKRRWPCLMIPSFEIHEDTIQVGRLSPSYGPVVSPEVKRKHEDSDKNRDAMQAALESWLLRSDDSEPRLLRASFRSEAITKGEHVSRRPLWSHIALNSGGLGGLVLLPWSIVTWRRCFQRMAFFRRSLAKSCVCCSYSLSNTANSTPTRCPECGTLNPPPMASAAHSSSSPAPSAQSAQSPPAPPATTQSPPQ